MKPFFKELFEYNHQMNQKLWTLLHDHSEQSSEKALKLYSHLLNAHHIWNHRIEGMPAGMGVWEQHPLDACKTIDQNNYEHTLRIIEKVDLSASIQYTTSQGQPFHNRIQDLLFHTINHATYHRGQIATECKLNGIDPLVSDYIFYKR